MKFGPDVHVPFSIEVMLLPIPNKSKGKLLFDLDTQHIYHMFTVKVFLFFSSQKQAILPHIIQW